MIVPRAKIAIFVIAFFMAFFTLSPRVTPLTALFTVPKPWRRHYCV
jgi:hypothetical protein